MDPFEIDPIDILNQIDNGRLSVYVLATRCGIAPSDHELFMADLEEREERGQLRLVVLGGILFVELEKTQ